MQVPYHVTLPVIKTAITLAVYRPEVMLMARLRVIVVVMMMMMMLLLLLLLLGRINECVIAK